jgi:hypothetical protein
VQAPCAGVAAISAQTPTLIGCLVFKEHAVFRSAQKRDYVASFFVCQVAVKFFCLTRITLLLVPGCLSCQTSVVREHCRAIDYSAFFLLVQIE